MEYLVISLSTTNNIFNELCKDRLYDKCAVRCICFGTYTVCRSKCFAYITK